MRRAGALAVPWQEERGRLGEGGSGLLVRDEDGVDDVHDTVGGLVVRGGDLGLVDIDLGVVDDDADLGALDGLDVLERLEVLGLDFAGHDVVGEDGLELLDVLRVEDVGEGLGRDLGKGLVGRREDGERAGTGKGVETSWPAFTAVTRVERSGTD